MKKLYVVLTLSVVFMVGCNVSETKTEERIYNHREVDKKTEVIDVVKEVVKEPTTYNEKIDQLLNDKQYDSLSELEKRQIYIDEMVEFANNTKASSNEEINEWLLSIRSDYDGKILHLELDNYRIALERVFKIEFAMRVFAEKGNTEVKNFEHYMYHFYRGARGLVHRTFLNIEDDTDGKYQFMAICYLMAMMEIEKEEEATNNQ